MKEKIIRCYLTLSFLSALAIGFIGSTYVAFLIANGLNLLEVNLVNLAFYASRFLCEIPTGAMADVFGRKKSFLASCFLISIGTFIYSVSDSFWGFIFAEMIAGIGFTFSSGAFEAWLVDRLRHYDFTESPTKIFSREAQLSQAATLIGALAGAFLADYNMSFPWKVSSFTSFATGAIAFFWMKEEYFTARSASWKSGIVALKDTVKSSLNFGIKQKNVRFIIVVGIVQVFALQAPNMQWQPFFSPFLKNKTGLGFVFTGISIALAIGAAFSSWILRKVKSEKKTLLFVQILIGLALVSATMPKNLIVIAFLFLIHEIGRGAFNPIKNAYLHDQIPSKERATIVSFESITCNLGGAVGLLVSGFLANEFGIPLAWVISGIVLVFFSLIFLKNGKG